jgi:hypothetical protein
MIKATELRVGNIVRTHNKGSKVFIPEMDFVIQGITIFKRVVFGHSYNVTGFERDEKHIVGTPLTELWLLKFGFKHFTESWYEKGFLSISIEHGVELNDEYNSTIKLPYEIQYVHQLQNLYFALTGKELEIKEAV